MAVIKYTRNKDFSDAETANESGRSTVDTAMIDSELDELKSVTDAIIDALDAIQRDDNELDDDIIKANAFSAAALTYLASSIGTNTALVWMSSYLVTNVYAVGNLAKDSGNAYISLKAQTASQYANFAAALADSAWEIFVEKGAGASFPSSPASDDLLYYDGATEAWGKLTAAMAPLFALKASPVFTGTLTMKAVKAGVTTDSSAASITASFTANFLHKIALAVNVTTLATSGRSAGMMMEIKITADGSGPYNLPTANAGFGADWVWIGTKPASIAASKTMVITLRCYGAAETDIVASYGVED